MPETQLKLFSAPPPPFPSSEKLYSVKCGKIKRERDRERDRERRGVERERDGGGGGGGRERAEAVAFLKLEHKSLEKYIIVRYSTGPLLFCFSVGHYPRTLYGFSDILLNIPVASNHPLITLILFLNPFIFFFFSFKKKKALTFSTIYIMSLLSHASFQFQFKNEIQFLGSAVISLTHC